MHISYIIDMFRRENAPGEKHKERRTYFENLSPTKPLLAWALTKVFSLPQELAIGVILVGIVICIAAVLFMILSEK